MQKSAGAFIVHNKKLLMMLRDNNPKIPNPNCWHLIGGMIEKGEEALDALVREIEEEVCIEVRRDDVKKIGKNITREKSEYFIYWIKLDDWQAENVRLGNEGQKIDFISVEELDKLKLSEKLGDYYFKHREGLNKLIEEDVLDFKELGFNEKGICYF